MLRRDRIWPLTLLVLIVIGILADARSLIIPGIIVGVVLILYFFPPTKWRYWVARMRYNRASRTYDRRQHTRSKPNKSRQVKLRVIEGHKRDEPEEPPRYH